VKESHYITATNIAKVRSAKSILHDLSTADKSPIPEAEWRHVMKCLQAWESRLERKVSRETARENSEPWLLKFPVDLPQEPK
jgi:hypothetical protein